MTVTLDPVASELSGTDVSTFEELTVGISADPSRLVAEIDAETVTGDDLRELEANLGRRIYQRRHLRFDENRTLEGRIERHLPLETSIAAAIGERSIRRPVSEPVADETAVSAIAFGARVRFPLDRISDVDTAPMATLPDVWPALSPGFLLVLGDADPVPEDGRALWRIYIGAQDPEPATRSFARVVAYLRGHARSWQAKIASTPIAYPRTDAITVYLADAERDHAAEVAKHAAGTGQVSAFAYHLAPGVGLAQEPVDPRRRNLSFGQHRATLVARSVMSRAGVGAPVDINTLRAAGVDPTRLWQNLRAEELIDSSHGRCVRHRQETTA